MKVTEYAVKLGDSGDGLRLLQEPPGHASFNTTARYRKVAGEERREWYQKLWRAETREDRDACQSVRRDNKQMLAHW